MNDVMKTGTTTLGLVCKDGIILAADKRATAGHFIVGKEVEKVIQVNDYMAVTIAGNVSDIQLLLKVIKAEINLKNLRTNRKSTVKEAANLLAGIVFNNIRANYGISHFIFAGYDDQGPQLYDIYPDGSIQKHDTFIASGSGSVIVYGVLETQYKKHLTLAEGQALALKAINTAFKRDIGSGEGILIKTITKDGVKTVADKTIQTTA